MKYNRISGISIAISLLVLVFVGCQKENTTLTLQMSDYDSGDKVYMTGSTAYWNLYDQLLINDEPVSIEEVGNTVQISVPTASTYMAVYPSEMAYDMTHRYIDKTQIYMTDEFDNQIVDAPMGAYSTGGTLRFTPLGSLLAVNVSNNTGHSAMLIDRIEVKASAVALCGDATIHDLAFSTRNYTIDAPYCEGVNDNVVLRGGDYSSMGVYLAVSDTKTFYIRIPAISSNVNNKFTITVYAIPFESDYPSCYSYTLSQHGDRSGNIPKGSLVNVPFELTSGIEVESSCALYYTTIRGDLSYQINDNVYANNTSLLGIAGSGDIFNGGNFIAYFSSPITEVVGFSFAGCTSLRSIVFPDCVTSIGSNAFAGCSNLVSVTCLSTVPPSLDNFGTIAANAVLHVPSGCIAAYQSSAWGSCFSNIIDDAVEPSPYYW